MMSVNSLALVRHANLSSHNFFVTVAIQNCGVKNYIIDLLVIGTCIISLPTATV